MPNRSSLYEQAVEICTDYLGPAGERFMRRQITTHLAKEPEALAAKDLPELTNWVRLTFAMLTDESRLIDDFAARLNALGTPSPRRRKHSVRK